MIYQKSSPANKKETYKKEKRKKRVRLNSPTLCDRKLWTIYIVYPFCFELFWERSWEKIYLFFFTKKQLEKWLFFFLLSLVILLFLFLMIIRTKEKKLKLLPQIYWVSRFAIFVQCVLRGLKKRNKEVQRKETKNAELVIKIFLKENSGAKISVVFLFTSGFP